jgi:hypothetical protein
VTRRIEGSRVAAHWIDVDGQSAELEHQRSMPDEGDPRIIAGRKSAQSSSVQSDATKRGQDRGRGRRVRDAAWVRAFKGGEPTCGDFLLAGPISEAFNLGAVSLRLGGKRLVWDAANMKVTNLAAANKYLVREYRKGWEL